MKNCNLVKWPYLLSRAVIVLCVLSCLRPSCPSCVRLRLSVSWSVCGPVRAFGGSSSSVPTLFLLFVNNKQKKRLRHSNTQRTWLYKSRKTQVQLILKAVFSWEKVERTIFSVVGKFICSIREREYSFLIKEIHPIPIDEWENLMVPLGNCMPQILGWENHHTFVICNT